MEEQDYGYIKPECVERTKLVSFLIYTMPLPDKETIFSHDFLELSKNAFIEKRKKTRAGNKKKLRKSGNMRCGRKKRKQNIGEDKAENSRMNLPKCSIDFTLRGMCKIGMLKGDE